MKPIVSMTLADLAHEVGVIMAHMIDTTHIMNPEAHWDWSLIVNPNRNLLEGLVKITRKYHEEVIEKRVRDYNEMKKIDKVHITANKEPSESMGKTGMAIVVFRIEDKVMRKRALEKMVDLL